MSKRRNLKKEKAERNKAYARQFRKPTSRFSSRKQQNSDERSNNNDNDNNSNN